MRIARADIDRLERELGELLGKLSAYRQAIDALEQAPAPPLESQAGTTAAAEPSARPEAEPGELPVGETGWILQGDGWLLRAPDGFRLRLNICERALMLTLAHAPDHVISLEDFFSLMSSTRAGFGQRPLAPSSMRMILMRLMRKLARSHEPCPIVSVHGWGYRLRVDAERLGADRNPPVRRSAHASPVLRASDVP